MTCDTSFSGKALLRTNQCVGNFVGSSFAGAGSRTLSQRAVVFQQDIGPGDGGDVVAIDRLLCPFPPGDFTLSVAGHIGQEDMPAIWPIVYPVETMLDVLTLHPGCTGGLQQESRCRCRHVMAAERLRDQCQ